MNNALSYLDWRGDLSFKADKFNEVDLFLCSQISTIDFSKEYDPDDGAVGLKESTQKFFATTNLKKENALGVLQSEYVLPMIEKIIKTKRFKNIAIWNPQTKIDNEQAVQFSAVTLVFPNNTIVVSYRGTDDTIIGWKEDCNIAVYEHVPAQELARKYLEEAAEHFPGTHIHVCGHSKGGNLAVYAASCASEKVQDRIDTAVSFDGPGFQDRFLKKEGYKRIKDKIFTVFSRNSIVGLLLTQAGTAVCVETSVTGPYAHDGFTWEVLGTKFVRCKELSDSSKTIKGVIDGTLAKMNQTERKTFVNELFGEILSTGATTVTDIAEMTTTEKYNLFVKLFKNKFVGKFAGGIGESALKEVFHIQIPESTEKYVDELLTQGLDSLYSIRDKWEKTKLENSKKNTKKDNSQ